MNRTRGVRANSTLWYNASSLILNRVLPTFVHKYDTQQYYNTVDGETSFPFTATRTTNATMFDGAGRLVWAPANMLINTTGFTTSWTKQNCSITGSAADPLGGSDGVEITDATTGAALYSVGATISSTTNYTLSFYVKAINTTFFTARFLESGFSNGVRIQMDLTTGVVSPISIVGAGTPRSVTAVDAGNGWWRVALTGSTGAGGATCVAEFHTATSIASPTPIVGGKYNIFGPQVEANGPDSPKSYIANNTGAAYYGPRFDCDPLTGETRGVLVEDARTNDITKGLNIIAGDVVVGGASVITSPTTYLGGWTAARVTGDGLSNSHSGALASFTPGSSTTRSIQAIIRPIVGTFFQLTGSGNWIIDANAYANFNCTGNGSVTATGASGSNAFIRPLRDGCYHIGVTVTTNAVPSAGTACAVGLITSGTDTRLPINTSANSFDFIYGCNSLGTGWHSIIPTFGVAATKAADNLTAATGAWADQTKGVMYADFMRGQVNSGSGNSGIFFQLYTDVNNRLALLSGSGTHSQHRFDVVNASVTQAGVQTSLGSTSLQPRKMVGSYILNNIRATENGVSGTDDVAGTVPTITTYSVGCSGTVAQLVGWVREVRYYADNSATNVQLQSITT